MQVSSITSTQANQVHQTQTGLTVKQQFENLDKALETGSLPQARQIYNNLQKQGIGQKISGANSPTDLDFAALGKALNSGDLAGAKQAFATLKMDYQYSAIAAKVQQAQNQAQSSIATLNTPNGTTSASTAISGLVSAAQLR